MVTLFEHPLSPYAQKVKIALAEKGVEFTPQVPDLLGGGDAAFRAASPRREVPALVDGDTAVFDSTIILEYIEDRWPTPPLLPEGAAARARVRQIEEVCDTYYEAINWAVYEIRVFQRATGALAEQMLARASGQVAGVNAYLERQLGTAEWFTGTRFGWGDLAAAPVVHAAAMSGNPPAAGGHLAAWLERVRARPSVAAAFEQAMHSFGGFEILPELVRSGHFVREYRDHRLEWMMRSGGADIVLDGMRQRTIRFGDELC
ncbi:MAG TPA: glutathione S-transferase family protein [Candidatus Dormibacteraeota bacterium]|nr:glutathione S-transferase family protein [Candidatus Dormibacteraeota bacterium]